MNLTSTPRKVFTSTIIISYFACSIQALEALPTITPHPSLQCRQDQQACDYQDYLACSEFPEINCCTKLQHVASLDLWLLPDCFAPTSCVQFQDLTSCTGSCATDTEIIRCTDANAGECVTWVGIDAGGTLIECGPTATIHKFDSQGAGAQQYANPVATDDGQGNAAAQAVAAPSTTSSGPSARLSSLSTNGSSATSSSSSTSSAEFARISARHICAASNITAAADILELVPDLAQFQNLSSGSLHPAASSTACNAAKTSSPATVTVIIYSSPDSGVETPAAEAQLVSAVAHNTSAISVSNSSTPASIASTSSAPANSGGLSAQSTALEQGPGSSVARQRIPGELDWRLISFGIIYALGI